MERHDWAIFMLGLLALGLLVPKLAMPFTTDETSEYRKRVMAVVGVVLFAVVLFLILLTTD